MDSKDKDALRARLVRGGAKEKSYAEKKRLEEAARRTKAERMHRRPAAQIDDECDGDRRAETPSKRTRRASSTDDERPRVFERGLVVGLARARALVRGPAGTRWLALARALADEQQSVIAVGDEVEIEGQIRVVAVEPRRSQLARPDPADPRRERVIAANIDVALIVASASSPPFSIGFVERAIAVVAVGGVRALVVVNKVDLASATEREGIEAQLEPQRSAGVEACFISAVDGTGLNELRDWLAGSRCVLLGHSGVGKSSLVNALAGREVAQTGDVRAGTGKGRHTTTGSSLERLSNGLEIIDTPGVRELGLLGVHANGTGSAFPDLRSLACNCRFRDCSHLAEPDCAVRAAVESGRITAERFAAYARFRASLEGS